MNNQLDQIVVTAQSRDRTERLKQIRQAVRSAAYFDIGDERVARVRDIISTIAGRDDRDQAVLEFTGKFDGVSLSTQQLAVTPHELENAHKQLDADLLNSLRKAIANVKKYQAEILITQDPSRPAKTGIRYSPLRRVGICIPGAAAPLPSTVIMTAVPARVAGVAEIAVVSPPRHNRDIHPVILGLCWELGITEVYRVGGVQAVAALALGTETIRAVDKIVGPGNQWVQTAKKELFGRVGIDLIAGPSEVLIIADDNANPAWVAADMLSQAEHDPASAVVFTTSQRFAANVLAELKVQLAGITRREQAARCLINYGAIVIFDSLYEMIAQADAFATEHLEIHCGPDSRKIASRINNAGAIFIGDYSPVAVGDYWAGPSHTLPTGTTARFFSALTANDFLKSTSIIEYDKDALAADAADIIRIAQAEGLDAHARSVEIRLRK